MVRLTTKKGKKGYAVHRLVAEAFIPNPNNLPIVNHKDENKTNNFLDNLEVISKKDNAIHACYQLGKIVKPVIQIKEDGTEIEYPSVIEASRQLKVTDGAIRYALKNNSKSCNSYWKYK